MKIYGLQWTQSLAKNSFSMPIRNVSSISVHFTKPIKVEQTKLKAKWRKEIIKIRVEIELVK